MKRLPEAPVTGSSSPRGVRGPGSDARDAGSRSDLRSNLPKLAISAAPSSAQGTHVPARRGVWRRARSSGGQSAALIRPRPLVRVQARPPRVTGAGRPLPGEPCERDRGRHPSLFDNMMRGIAKILRPRTTAFRRARPCANCSRINIPVGAGIAGSNLQGQREPETQCRGRTRWCSSAEHMWA